MPSLEKRMRTIMKREKLTYEQVSAYAGVSTQAVHKWLSKGSISDEKAKELAEQIGFDWLWLKYGLNRIPLEGLSDLVMESTNNMLLTRWDTLEIVACSDNFDGQFDIQREDLIGRTLYEVVPKLNYESLRKGQKLIFAIGGMVEHSFRCTFQDVNSSKALLVESKGITTDDDGVTYELTHIHVVEPDGTEDSYQSLRFHRKRGLSLSDEEIGKLSKKYPEWPWLKSFLSD